MMQHSSRADEWISIAMERYLDMVYRLAHARTGSRQDAEDVSQEVMLRLVKNASQIESEAHLKAWLIRVTVNQSNNLFRSAWRRLTAPLEEGFARNAEEPPSNDRLDDALDRLSPKLRTVVHLYYYEEMTVEEIAAAIGVRPDAVKMRLSRARRILKQQLTDKGGRNDVQG